jgi:hypothetical protein
MSSDREWLRRRARLAADADGRPRALVSGAVNDIFGHPKHCLPYFILAADLSEEERAAGAEIVHPTAMIPDERKEIYSAIEEERQRQIALLKYDAAHDAKHSPNDWLAILSRALGLAGNDGGIHEPTRYRRQLVRLAALAVAALEAQGENS